MTDFEEKLEDIFEGIDLEYNETDLPLSYYKKQLLLKLENIKQLESKYERQDIAERY